MKLFINSCHSCNSKIPLAFTATNRQQIRYAYGNAFNIQCPVCHNVNTYTPSLIFAETDSNAAVGGGVVGGLIGLLGGPIGFVIGAAVGSAIGNTNDTEDKNKVRWFNLSQ